MTNKNDDRLFKKDGKTVNRKYIARKRSKEKNQKLFSKAFLFILGFISISIIIYNVYMSNYMKISQIYIKGNKKVTDTDIIAQLGNPIGKNILLYDTDEYVGKVKNLDYIDGVTIKKVFPKILSIHVKEEYPLFYERAADNYYYISNDLLLMDSSKINDDNKKSLVEIKGVTLSNNIGDLFTSSKVSLEFIEKIQQYPFFNKVKQLNLENKADIGIITKDIDIEFGDLNNIDYKLKLLESIFHDIEIKGLKPVSINLRKESQPIVELDKSSFSENLNY